jgi:mannosyltransferase OCH1-like enzyme
VIPKRIFTVWVDEQGRTPELVRRCIASQKLEGYEYFTIGYQDLGAGNWRNLPYVDQCLKSPHIKRRWCKLSDYLRMRVLLDGGGIYLDADVEVLPGRNFDALLGSGLFVGREQHVTAPGAMPFAGTAVVGAEPGHPLIAEWLRRVEARFRGDDDKNFESSMMILNDLLWERGMCRGPWALSGVDTGRVEELPAEVFYPYCHERGEVHVTDRTLVYHHFLKSWVG